MLPPHPLRLQVGSHVNAHRGLNADGSAKIEMLPLNHAELLPVWAECARLGACLMVHPWDMEWWCVLDWVLHAADALQLLYPSH